VWKVTGRQGEEQQKYSMDNQTNVENKKAVIFIGVEHQ
jgi:hypothetical protein